MQGSHCVWPCLSPGCNGSHLLAPDGTFPVIGYEICYNHCLPVPGMPQSSDGSPEARCHYSVEPTPSLHLSANRYDKLNQDNRIKRTSTLKSQDVPDRCCCSQDGPSHGKCKKSVRLVFPDPQSYQEVPHTTPWNTSETHKRCDSAEPEICVWWSELYKLGSVSIYTGCCLVLQLAQFLCRPALYIL